MDVVELPIEIVLVADRMLPRTAPPNGLLPFRLLARRERRFAFGCQMVWIWSGRMTSAMVS